MIHPPPTLPARRAPLREALADLHPGYFAVVMATGIISVAAELLQVPALAQPLYYVNIVLYAVLGALLLTRLTLFPRRVMHDLGDHLRGAGFFTVVAATCVLGQQVVLVAHRPQAGAWLWVASAVLWGPLIYGFLTAAMVTRRKPTLDRGISGSWLLAVVATQALSLLGALVVRGTIPWRQPFFLLTLSLYLVGCLLYLIIITLIFYRLAFFAVDVHTLSPAFWINMGAVSISTAAGATLLADLSAWPMLLDLAPFVKGVTLAFWAVATWWIPLLLLLGAWRHLYRRFPIRYNMHYWAMVFPLGMYAAATARLSYTASLPFILPLARVFLYGAALAWVLAAAGLTHRLVSIGRGLPADADAGVP